MAQEQNKQIKGTLENWVVLNDDIHTWVEGNIYGHAEFYDGMYIHTSKLISLDMSKNILETKNSLYRLGKHTNDGIH